MRALLKSEDDNTLIVVFFYQMDYDRNDKSINIHGEYEDYTVEQVSEIQYNDFAHKLFLDGYVDLSLFPAN